MSKVDVQTAEAKLLLGKPVADAICECVAARAQACVQAGVQPKLVCLRVGENSADVAYERNVIKRAAALGVEAEAHVLDANVSQEALLEVVRAINADAQVHGCLLFRPLPAHIDERCVCDALAPEKDVDCIGKGALAKLFVGEAGALAPATAQACVNILQHYGVPLEGARVAVVGRSLVIGKPLAMLLLAQNATVCMCHSKSANLAEITAAADIVVCATGRARAFDAQYFKPGQVVLDVGTNTDAAGVFCGDVDFDAAASIVGAITPVPRGVGSVTTSVLVEHVVAAAERAL